MVYHPVCIDSLESRAYANQKPTFAFWCILALLDFAITVKALWILVAHLLTRVSCLPASDLTVFLGGFFKGRMERFAL